MADQLRTTESDLYERAFPSKYDLAYWLGQVLQAPVSGMPTQEDYRREQGEIGLPTEEQSATQSGANTLDYVTQFLGPLLALMTSQQYARQPSGRPARTWSDQADYTRSNSPLEALAAWKRSRPWENRPPEGESAWTWRQPPAIGGPTGQGMGRGEARFDREKDMFQARLKEIRALELDEALKKLAQQGGSDPGGPFKPPPLPGD